MWLSGLSLWTERLLVWFPIRACVGVVGHVLNWGWARGNWSTYLSHIDVPLPLFLLPLLLKVNRNLFKKTTFKIMICCCLGRGEECCVIHCWWECALAFFIDHYVLGTTSKIRALILCPPSLTLLDSFFPSFSCPLFSPLPFVTSLSLWLTSLSELCPAGLFFSPVLQGVTQNASNFSG